MRRSSCLTGSCRNRNCRFWLPEILSRCPPCAPVWHNRISPRNGFGAVGKGAYAEEFGCITLAPFTPGKRAFAKIRLSYDISCLPVWPVHLSGKASPMLERAERSLLRRPSPLFRTCPTEPSVRTSPPLPTRPGFGFRSGMTKVPNLALFPPSTDIQTIIIGLHRQGVAACLRLPRRDKGTPLPRNPATLPPPGKNNESSSL
jgi:hypothetical protein